MFRKSTFNPFRTGPVADNIHQQLYFNAASPLHFPQPCLFRHVRRTAVATCRVKRGKYSTAGLHDENEKHDLDFVSDRPKVPLDNAKSRRKYEAQLKATPARKAEKAERRRIVEKQQKTSRRKETMEAMEVAEPLLLLGA
jgi:uncharacterized protein YaiL (DUF2058 family)